MLEGFLTNIYKVSSSEPLATRMELVHSYSEKYQSHYIVESYVHTPSSSFSTFKLEAVSREEKGYPLQQDFTIPELHMEFDSGDSAEKQRLFDALPANRKKPN
jgi:hypothetical protein